MMEGRNAVMRVERLLAVAGGVGGEAPGTNELGQSEPGGRLVFDDEHPLAGGVRRRHNRILACRFYTVQQIQPAQPFRKTDHARALRYRRSRGGCRARWWLSEPQPASADARRHRRDGNLFGLSDPDRPGAAVPRRRPGRACERRADFAALRGRGVAGRHGAAARAHAVVPASKRPDRSAALARDAGRSLPRDRPRRAVDAADPCRRRPAAPGIQAVGPAAPQRAGEPARGPGAPRPDAMRPFWASSR